jgi:type I restriction enzyme, S subunit
MHLLEQFENLTLHPKNAARLKELVLQLAVQGKLTENWRKENPDVEPASELLKRIEAVKDKKVREQPSKPIIEDELPYTIPDCWQWMRLGDLIELKYGKSLTKAQTFDDGKFPVYGSNGVVGFYNEYLTSKKSIIIGRKGSAGALNLCLCPSWTTDVAYYVEEIYGLNIDFLFRLLKTLNLDKLGKGIKPGLNRNEAYIIYVPLPPLAEQEAIVSRVEELMKKIEELEKKSAERIQLKKHLGAAALQQLTEATEEDLEQHWLFLKEHFHTLFDEEENVKKLRETILQLAVQGKLTASWRKENPATEPASELLKRIQAEKEQLVKEKKIKKEKPLKPISVDEVPYELPEGWVWCRFSNIATVASNLVNPSDYLELPHIAPDNIEKYTGRLLNYKTVKEDNLISSKHLFFEGQILYSKIRPRLNKVIEIDFHGLCSADMYPIDSKINRSYLFRYMLSEYFVHQSTETEGRVAMPKINQVELNKILIPVPPSQEQKVIVAKIDELIQLCDDTEKQIKQSKQESEKLMQTIVQDALDIHEVLL